MSMAQRYRVSHNCIATNWHPGDVLGLPSISLLVFYYEIKNDAEKACGSIAKKVSYGLLLVVSSEDMFTGI